MGIVLFLISIASFAQQRDTTRLTIQPVEVVGKNRVKIQPTTIPTQLIGKTDISQLGIQSMADAVRRFAGVTVKDYGGIGGLKTVSVRGFGAQHTAVAIDGITASNAQSGQIDIGQYSLENVSFVSLETGQSDDIFQPARNFASAALLNIVSQIPDFTDKPYAGIVRLKGGSFGQFNPYLSCAKKLSNSASLSLNGEYQHANGNYSFKFNNGASIEDRKRANSDVDIYRLECNFYKKWNKSELAFKSNYYDANRGLPGATISNNLTATERLITRNFSSQFTAKHNFSDKWSWKGAAQLNYMYERYSNANSGTKVTDRYRQYEYYTTSSLLYQPSENWKFSLAQDFAHSYLFSIFGQSALDSITYPNRIKAYRNSYLTALNTCYKSGKVTVVAGLLGAYFAENVNKGTASKDKKRVSPNISFGYDVSNDWLVRISYKDIFRVPSLNDMYYTQAGNSSLKPEIARQLNLGTTFRHNYGNDRLSFSVDGYYNNVKNKIVAVLKMFNSKMQNVGNVRILGTDTRIEYDKVLNKSMSLHFSGTYSYQNAENTDLKQQIIYTPQHSGNAAISWGNPWVNVAYSVVFCGSEWSQQYHSSLNKIDAYADQSVSLNKSFQWKKQHFRIQLDLLNLSNKNYEIIKNYPMPGRSFLLSGTWKI